MDDIDYSTVEQQGSRPPSAEKTSSTAITELADELQRLEEQTDDGWFKAEITQIRTVEEDDRITVTVVLTAEETATWHLDKPKRWTDEYLFVRLADQYGYGASAITLLEGEYLRIRPATNTSEAVLDATGAWEFHDPRFETQSHRTAAIAKVVLKISLNIIVAIICIGILISVPGVIAVQLLPEVTAEMIAKYVLSITLFLTSVLFINRYLIPSQDADALSDSEPSSDETDEDDIDYSTVEQQGSRPPPAEKTSSTATTEFVDELQRLEVQTDDGWFKAEITQIGTVEENGQIAVTVALTAEETATWHLDKPKRWTDEYLFVRLANQYGDGASAITLLEGEYLRIRPATDTSEAVLDTTGAWEFHDPRFETQSHRTATIARVVWGRFIMFITGCTIMGYLTILLGIFAVWLLPGVTVEVMAKYALSITLLFSIAIEILELINSDGTDESKKYG